MKTFDKSAQPVLLALVFAVVCVVSAMALVYTRHESRKLFIELERLTAMRDELNIEWGRLQIEQSTWATHARIERVATEKLALSRPSTDEIYVIERPTTDWSASDGERGRQAGNKPSDKR